MIYIIPLKGVKNMENLIETFSPVVLIVIGLIFARWGTTIWKYLTLFGILIGLAVSAGSLTFLIDNGYLEWNQHAYIIGIAIGITLLHLIIIKLIKSVIKFAIIFSIAGGLAYTTYEITHEEKYALIIGAIGLVISFILFDKILKFIFALLGGLISGLGSFILLSEHTNLGDEITQVLSAIVLGVCFALAYSKKKEDKPKGNKKEDKEK